MNLRCSTADQCTALAKLADALVPGAAAAGFAAYIDLQLQAGDASLLIGKYLGVDTTAQTGFYQSAADNLIALASKVMSFSDYGEGNGLRQPLRVDGATLSYVLFVLRADALDVTYGTPEAGGAGYPLHGHIMPETPW